MITWCSGTCEVPTAKSEPVHVVAQEIGDSENTFVDDILYRPELKPLLTRFCAPQAICVNFMQIFLASASVSRSKNPCRWDMSILETLG